MIFQPETPEDAARVAESVHTAVEMEFFLSEENLENYGGLQQTAHSTVRELTQSLTSQVEQGVEGIKAHMSQLEDAKGNALALREFYNGILADIENKGTHGITDMDIVTDVKDRSEKLAAEIENLEADLNQALNLQVLLKEHVNTAYLRYKDAISEHVGATRAGYDEFAKNSALVMRNAEELKQIAEAIALQ